MAEKRKLISRISVKLMVVITAIAMVAALIPANLLQAEAATTLNNPTIKNNENAEPTVTWDCIYFGRYEQNFNCIGGEAGGFKIEPIKWRVLAVNGDDAFLLADKILDSKKYNEVRTATTWEKSTIRSWLNGYDSTCNAYGVDYTNEGFIDRAFTEAEQRAIKTTLVVNKNNPEYGTDGGNNTNDKVYFLSTEEIANQAYGFTGDFDDYYDKAKRAKTTEYAKYLGAETSTSEKSYYGVAIYGNGEWWLRSPGYTPDDVYIVNTIGRVYDYVVGTLVNDSRTAVRPVLHLDLSSDVWSYAGTVSSDDAYEQIDNPHDWSEWKANNDGKTHSRNCEYECGTKETASHFLGVWETTKEPTEDEEGIRVRSCNSCSYTETEPLLVLKTETAAKINLKGTITGHTQIAYDSVKAWLKGLDGSIYSATVSNGVLDKQTGKTEYEYIVSAPKGQYSLMVEAVTNEGVVVTRNAVVKLKKSSEEKNVNLPNGQAKSEVKSEKGAVTTLVDGLDGLADVQAEAEAVPTDAVMQVTFIVSEPDPKDKGKENIRKVAPKNCELQFMDFTIQKTMFYKDGNSEDLGLITDTGNSLLSIIVPFDTQDKDILNVYRYHDEAVDIIGFEPNDEREYMEVFDDHIIIHAKKFSTYGIGYDEKTVTAGGNDNNSNNNNNQTVVDGSKNDNSKTDDTKQKTSQNEVGEKTADTGDSTTLKFYIAIMLLSLVTGTAVTVFRRKGVK